MNLSPPVTLYLSIYTSSMSKLFTTLFVLWSFDSSSLLSSAFPYSPTLGSRAILRAAKLDSDQPDLVGELNAKNFDAALKETTATYAIVEFFAHWCPACRNYRPKYEKVARLFNGKQAIHPGIILMTRVDCANRVNTFLCGKFRVPHFPFLLWGPSSKFITDSWNAYNKTSEISHIKDYNTAESLLKYINTQLNSSYELVDDKFQNDRLLHSNVSDTRQIAQGIYDVEESTALAFEIILEHEMIKSDTRAILIKFLQVMVAHHPSRRCRKGTADVLMNFDDLYPSNMNGEPNNGTGLDAFRAFHICGNKVPRDYWMFCRGSTKDTRGFSCGLWVLLHSLSVRLDDAESNMAFTATCDFIHKFFICEECRQHFYEMCKSVSAPSNTREYVLWLWAAHNKVNERLMKTEASLGTGDPRFPKTLWPPKQLCSTCYAAKNQKWVHDEVFKFLIWYYGNRLVSSYQDKDTEIIRHINSSDSEYLVASTNALAVPMGAAMAIAVASCLFGALAYVWRSRQKNQKYFYKPHF